MGVAHPFSAVATPEAGVEVVLFLLVAPAAQGLQVAEVVRATSCQGDNVVNREVCLSVGLATALAVVRISLEDIFPNCRGNGDARGFAHGRAGGVW